MGDNYYAALNSAVFSDGSFVYIPKGVKSAMELSTYFRINAQETGQVGFHQTITQHGSHDDAQQAACLGGRSISPQTGDARCTLCMAAVWGVAAVTCACPCVMPALNVCADAGALCAV